MAVYVGSARGDENGGAYGGKAGDQTGNEVSAQKWYRHSKGWRVFRAKDPAAALKIAYDMEMACANSHIGYDQYQRDTLYKAAEPVGFDCGKVATDCETDCSALVRVCCAYAGIMLPNYNTETQPNTMLKSGAFDELTGERYTDSSDRLRAGDILVTRTKGHTVVVLGDGPLAWEEPGALRKGDKGDDVKALQQTLLALGYGLGAYGPDRNGVDGDFGSMTETAVKAFQAANGLTADGVAGAATMAALEKALGESYTVTVTGLSKLEAESIRAMWPRAEVTRG